MHDMYCFREILDGALPTVGASLSNDFEDCISLRDEGRFSIERIISESNTINNGEQSLAACLVFFHRDFMNDIPHCDPRRAIELLEQEIEKGNIFLPQRFGRTLYDRFNQSYSGERLEHLDPGQVDSLLLNTDPGVYQVGHYVTGPLGILNSSASRYAPPRLSLPLWHCEDPGCQAIHAVDLLRHECPMFIFHKQLEEDLIQHEGPASRWERRLQLLHVDLSGPDRSSYYDLSALVADTLSVEEKRELLRKILSSSAAGAIRPQLKSRKKTRAICNKSPTEIADFLNEAGLIQILLLASNEELIRSIDACIFEKLIKVPLTEVRSARMKPPKIISSHEPSSISIFGIRSRKYDPVLYLSSVIWKAYAESNQLGDLAWLCRKGAHTPQLGEVLEYLRNYTAKDAIQELIIRNRNIFTPVLNELRLDYDKLHDDPELVDKMLWKFGFNPARFDMKYGRLRSQLSALKEEAIKSPKRLSADDRDNLRSKGVNVFVSLENTIEELLSYNIWVLNTDHFSNKFRYKFADAIKTVGATLGDSVEIKGNVFGWLDASGGNNLGTLLVYCRLAVDWMNKLSSHDKSSFEKSAGDLPFFVDDPIAKFPFLHTALWADASAPDLNDFISEFKYIVEQLEGSKIAEIRNGLDHYRNEEQFPTADSIIACEGRLNSVLDRADIKRLIPKTYHMCEFHSDEYGIIEFVSRDYRSQRMSIRRPSMLSGLPEPKQSKAFVVPFGNLLGQSNSEMLFFMEEDSQYSSMWANYPSRKTGKLTLAVGQLQSHHETNQKTD